MTACPALDLETAGLAHALRAIDCRTGEGTQLAFGRLFGDHGALLPALTGLLTLYVAIFAIGLLTGRTRTGIASLTPRMLTLGLVLTFATSWLAYQHVVWTLAVGAPDQLATMIAGTHGSATAALADKLDLIFSAIADSTQQTPTAAVSAAGATANGASPTGLSILSPQGMMWISGLMLLVGTVGVLVTAKIVLAALLALGPVFIVLAIFPGTRGLSEGWLKAVVSSALVPLFTVLIGGAMLSLITPLIRDAVLDSSTIATRSATALFLAACVYSALMVIVARTAGTIVSGWRIPFLHAEPIPSVATSPPVLPISPLLPAAQASVLPIGERVRSMIAALPPAAASDTPAAIVSTSRARAVVVGMAPAPTLLPAPRSDPRANGIGSRFRARPDAPAKARMS